MIYDKEYRRRFYQEYLQELSADDLKMLDSDATSIGDENFKRKLANVAGTSSALAEPSLVANPRRITLRRDSGT